MSPKSINSMDTAMAPASDRAMSSMSLIIPRSTELDLRTSSQLRRSSASAPPDSNAICASVMMEVSGVRSSRFTMESKSLFTWDSFASFSLKASRLSRWAASSSLARRKSWVRASTCSSSPP